ncbi:unnamed protein product, partial [Symbiodinium sp. KB8]
LRGKNHHGRDQHEPYDHHTEHREPGGGFLLGVFYRTGRPERENKKREWKCNHPRRNHRPSGTYHPKGLLGDLPVGEYDTAAREGKHADLSLDLYLSDEHHETPHHPPHGGRARKSAWANLELYSNLHLGEFYGTGRRRASPTTHTPRRGKGNHEPDGILSTGESYRTGRREHSKPRLDGDACGNLEPYGILLLGEHYTAGRRKASYSTGGR